MNPRFPTINGEDTNTLPAGITPAPMIGGARAEGDPQEVVARALLAQLSTKDKRLKEYLDFEPPNAESNALAQDLTPDNINALLRQRDRYKEGSPQWNALNQEFERLRDAASNLLGPIRPEPIPGMLREPGVQRMPYDPVKQSPGFSGGYQVPRRKFGY